MGYRFEQKTLSSGETVTLAYWEDLAPTRHGQTLQNRAWDEDNGRSGLGFYASTSEYMHNEWARDNMSPQQASLPGKGSLLLYHYDKTDTWHSADALDIDHIAQWKDHFEDRDVRSHADAHQAYNDVDNLRLLPAPVNRARDAAFRVLDTHGPDSAEWKQWVEDRFSFDSQRNHPSFDPDVDGVQRTRTTREQPWRPEDGREGLSFDASVLGKWYQNKLQECSAGEVELTSPTSGEKVKVPLFFCQASGQLCTRDAFDIDHEIPFSVLGAEMAKHGGPDGLSKADALDGYNDTSNLRLVGRTVNSSHDFEMDLDGNYNDEYIEPEQPGEFDDLIASDDDEPELTPQTLQQLRELGRQYRVPDALMSEPGHPGNRLFGQALDQLERSDVGQAMTGQQRENAAGVLAVAATHYRLGSIDQVAPSEDGSRLFAIQGRPENGVNVWVEAQSAQRQSLAESTLQLNQINYEHSQQAQQQQTQRNATMH